MANLKFTFKKHIKGGRYHSFELDYTDIKIKSKICGSISEINSRHPNAGKYRVGFMVNRKKTEQDPAPFRWAWVKRLFASESEARTFVTEKGNEVLEQAKVELYLLEE